MGDEHPGVARARRYIELFDSGDTGHLDDFFADDVVWHVAGRHPLSGDYRGRDALLGYFSKIMGLTRGTLTTEAESIMATDKHTALFTRVRGHRDGKTLDSLLAQILTVGPDGRWTEYWAMADDQDAVDDFWS